jgi:hypothetical protein
MLRVGLRFFIVVQDPHAVGRVHVVSPSEEPDSPREFLTVEYVRQVRVIWYLQFGMAAA